MPPLKSPLETIGSYLHSLPKYMFKFALIFAGAGLLFYFYTTIEIHDFRRDRAEADAIREARSVGAEGEALAIKLSSLLADREFASDDDSRNSLNKEIDSVMQEIRRMYVSKLLADRREPWQLQVQDIVRSTRAVNRLNGGNISETPSVEFCYIAFDNQYWPSAPGHCLFHALRNDPQSQFIMAQIYENGWGVSDNLVHAYSWYSIAAANRYLDSRDQRDRLSTLLSADELRVARQVATACLKSDFSDCALDIEDLRPTAR